MSSTECYYCFGGYDQDGRICMFCSGSGKLLDYSPDVEKESQEKISENSYEKVLTQANSALNLRYGGKTMKLTQVASAKRTNPSTIEHFQPCFVYTFDTGNTLTIWNDGYESYQRKNKTSMPFKCEEIRKEMKRLAMLGIK